MNRYRHPAMKQFSDQQVRFAPRERKAAQLARAETLLTELQPERSYPYQFVCYRVTDYRSDAYPDLMLSGADLIADLRRFIEDVSYSADLAPVEAGEPVLTVEEVSKEFNISTKTVNRWRQRGLVSRRFLVRGRRRVGFLLSSIKRFVKDHDAEVRRGANFSQLTDEERDAIVRRARRMARTASTNLAEISRRIARWLARSPETIRYTIKNHDREHPERAIFPAMRGPLDGAMKQTIFNAYRRGVSIESLAERYHRTRTAMYRVINEARAERLLAQPLDYMHHKSFDAKDADEKILGAEPVGIENARTVRPPAGLPAYLQSLYETPLLTREQEQYLFRKMNYLLSKAKSLRDKIDPKRVRASMLDEIERLQDGSLEIKRRLIRANLRLVVSIAKRHVSANNNLFELISDGNVSLMRAVEKFDFSRGFKFSTYASWAIMKNFARTIPAELTQRERFQTGQENAFDLTPDGRGAAYESELSQERIQSAIGKILNRLEERERNVIICRYGLADRTSPQTLEQVGNTFGVTKERIRQIEARAIGKLKQFATEDKLDLSFLG